MSDGSGLSDYPWYVHVLFKGGYWLISVNQYDFPILPPVNRVGPLG